MTTQTNFENAAVYHFETREQAEAFQRKAPGANLFFCDTTLTPPDFAEMAADRGAAWGGIDWIVSYEVDVFGYERAA